MSVRTEKATTWSRNPIDRFVLARLDAHGLWPNPPASRRERLRRLYYDLTGLPPTLAQVSQFESDNRSGAYQRRVDQLLAKPAYGEKWGRHWLDLVRYAETNGYERDGPKPQAWRYRDYVIRALNDGKPYDRFVLEQLAGDELTSHVRKSSTNRRASDGETCDQREVQERHDALIATGYYRLGVWDDEPVDADQAYYDSLDDVVSTTSLVLMATTVGCARCHDHKIDPIPQRDYYRMMAFFHNIYNNVKQQQFKKSAFTLNTLTEIATEQQRQQHAEHRKLHQHRLEYLQRQYQVLEKIVFDSLSAPEQEDAASKNVRRQLVGKRAKDALSNEQLRAFRELESKISELRRSGVPELPQALTIRENGHVAPKTHVLIRGNAHAKGDLVQPGFLEVLSGGASSSPNASDENDTSRDSWSDVSIPELPDDADSSGRRLAFARWLVDDRNPLTARVIVNRVWQHHFGRGLARTTSDFGKYGESPTHPQLLDYLAKELIAHDWHLKWLHRLIVTSNTYQMSSRDRADGLADDPENHLFWRYDIRRLTAEELRDTVLSVTGQLNDRMGGPSVFSKIPDVIRQSASRPDAAWGDSPPADQVRRSVYVYVKRSVADPVLSSFDAADTDGSCPVRFATTVPTQSLITLNGEFFNEQADLLADRLQREVGDDISAQVGRGLQLALSRQPTERELERGVKLIHDWQHDDNATLQQARKYFCLLVLNLNEMIYLD